MKGFFFDENLPSRLTVLKTHKLVNVYADRVEGVH
jgi:hypothetical protein